MICACGKRAVTVVPDPRCQGCAETWYAGLLAFARLEREVSQQVAADRALKLVWKTA